MSENQQDNAYGDLIKIVPNGGHFAFEIVATGIQRWQAILSAKSALSDPCFTGLMRQILFIDRDGYIELWDIIGLNKK